jgi:hypothetical protein
MNKEKNQICKKASTEYMKKALTPSTRSSEQNGQDLLLYRTCALILQCQNGCYATQRHSDIHIYTHTHTHYHNTNLQFCRCHWLTLGNRSKLRMNVKNVLKIPFLIPPLLFEGARWREGGGWKSRSTEMIGHFSFLAICTRQFRHCDDTLQT